MADDLEKDILRAQRNVAAEVATNQVVETAEARAERDAVIGVAAATAQERDIALMQRNTAAAQRDVVREDRDAAHQYAAVKQGEARSSAIGFYVLLGIVAVGLLIWAVVAFSRSTNPQTPPVVTLVTPAPAPVVVTPPVHLAPHSALPEAVTPVYTPPPAQTAPAPPPLVRVAPAAPSVPTASTGPANPAPATDTTSTTTGNTTTSSSPDSGTSSTSSTDTSGSTTTTTTTTTSGNGQ